MEGMERGGKEEEQKERTEGRREGGKEGKRKETEVVIEILNCQLRAPRF